MVKESGYLPIRSLIPFVQDASYLVTVPLVVPEVPFLKRDPVVAYMVDLFTKPCPFQADVVIDIEPYLDTIVSMLVCHRSQVFEFLPFNQRMGQQVPDDADAKIEWLRNVFVGHIAERADRFRSELVRHYGEQQGRQALADPSAD